MWVKVNTKIQKGLRDWGREQNSQSKNNMNAYQPLLQG